MSAAACAFIVLGWGSAAGAQPMSPGESIPAAPGLSWGNGIEAVLPADASATVVTVARVSCPSAGNCSAVGSYDGIGLLLTETAGSWAPGIEAVGPATTPSGPITSVSCPSAGDCSAVGPFDSSGNPLLLTETAGNWSPGAAAPLPANASTNPVASLKDVSCASVGNCTAVGTYTVGTGLREGLLLTETAGTWATGVEAKLPADARAANQTVDVDSVSCASAGNCSAVGSYFDDAGNTAGLLLTETAGSWSPGVEAVVPPNASVSTSLINSVSCVSAGNCTAVGEYDYRRGLLLTETAGSWAPGIEAVAPNSDVVFSLSSVSCPSAGNCAAVGTYNGENQSAQGMLLSETDGNWSAAVEAMPADVLNAPQLPSPSGQPLIGLQSVSCASAGNCTAVGGYADGFGNVVPLLVTETAGDWSTGAMGSLPANAGTPELAVLDSVSCPETGPCGAGGFYSDSIGSQGLLTGDSPPVVKVDISKNGTGSGTVSSVSAGIDCGSVCSASFDAGTSLTLTATPSVGSQLDRWSGGGCSEPVSCEMHTVVSDRTVTATFGLLPKCVVPRVKGKALKAAKRAIRSHNCTVGRIRHATSRRVKKGRVLSQKPRAGEQLRHGARVNLVVSEGR